MAVFLIGNAGSGKSSVAKRLAADDRPLFQIDSYYQVTPRTDASIEWSRDASYRRRAYKALERDVLRAVGSAHHVIVETTGASAHTAALYRRLVNRRGLTTVVIHLCVSRETARARIRARNRSTYPIKCPEAFVDLAAEALETPSLPIDFVVDGNAGLQRVVREVRSILTTLRP